jgi:deoxyribonuclease V
MTLLSAEIPDLPVELDRLLRQIPAGSVTTYGNLARALGDVVAARWVGEYLASHPHTEECPCHRVVRQTGEIGLFVTGNPQDKIDLLRDEGVVTTNGRVSLQERLVAELDSSSPLMALRDRQADLPNALVLTGLKGPVRSIGGVDISYASATQGVAAYVRLDAVTGELLWSTTVSAPVTFPYIPGYLTFRELPLHAALFEQVRKADQQADVTLIDGNGILHPRRAGSASACGVAVATPTIGIGKKLLCGQVSLDDLPPGEARPVIHQREQVGVAIRSGKRNRPFFASPGHGVDMQSTIDIVLRSLGRWRLPMPIFHADRLSRQEASRLSD